MTFDPDDFIKKDRIEAFFEYPFKYESGKKEGRHFCAGPQRKPPFSFWQNADPISP
jgi:hypothetical protein